MLRVLIADSNSERRENLVSVLKSKELAVSSMSSISAHNYKNTISYTDVIVMLDQSHDIMAEIIEITKTDKAKLILINQLANKNFANHIIQAVDGDITQEVLLKIERLLHQNQSAKHTPIAEDPKTKSIMEIAKKAAKNNVTVLLSGETGVGKEVLAQYIHENSIFQNGPFVSVNCAALPENMMEAILFGYEKGAFTSAINTYIGKFEQAHNGTLLLDEISETSLGLQAKLLRVLQEREVERLGGKKTIHINVRIIAATNRDLHQQVADGQFRKDLYYRLNVLPIHCAALRERILDIVPLAEYFILEHAKSLERKDVSMTVKAKQKLMNYSWPGNIRELENVIQRTLIMTENDVLDAEDFQLVEMQTEHRDDVVVNINQFSSKLEASEAMVIMDVLEEVNGCRNTAARKLNISPRTLRYKIAKLRSVGLKIPK